MKNKNKHTNFTLKEEITHKEFGPMLDSFVSFASDKLGIKSVPSIKYKDGKENFTSFGGYNPSENSIVIATKNRHPMDIYRTLAHELVHHKQNEDGRIKDVAREGSTGSPIEDEANAVAGKIMRWFAKANPENFDLTNLVENKAVFVVGVPCSGKDFVVRQLKEDNYQEIDIQTLHKTNIVSENVVISAVAHDYNIVEKAKNLLEHNGFVTELVFVDVSNEISKLRNEQRQARGQRMIAESIRFKKYNQSKENYIKFESLFEGRITKVMNDDLKEACWKGYTQPKKKKLKPKEGSPGQFVPNCVPKKSNIDEKFSKHIDREDSSKREWGTKSLTDMYKRDTPGQSGDVPSKTFPMNPLFEKKMSFKRKKKLEEDGLPSTLDAYNSPYTIGNSGIGDEYGTRFPGSLYGVGSATSVSSVPGMGPAGTLYPFGTYGIAESVIAWANKPETIERFNRKYGELAEQKLIEAAHNLNKSADKAMKMPKTFKQLREAWEAIGKRDMGTVPAPRSQSADSEMYEDKSPAWTRKEGQDPEGGLNRKGIASYRRANPGSKLSMAVTTKPSKLDPDSKAAKRRKSFCARMGGMKKRLTSSETARDPDSRINKALRKWNCEE